MPRQASDRVKGHPPIRQPCLDPDEPGIDLWADSDLEKAPRISILGRVGGKANVLHNRKALVLMSGPLPPPLRRATMQPSPGRPIERMRPWAVRGRGAGRHSLQDSFERRYSTTGDASLSLAGHGRDPQ